jgi:hypothetical protein
MRQTMPQTVTMIAATLLAMPVLSAAAHAQSAPPQLRPTRDVAVTYRMLGNSALAAGAPGGAAAGPQEIRMAWAVSAGKQRVDPPGGTGWMLIDRKANSAVMVMEAQRMIMTMPPQTVAAMTQEMPPEARFTRKGSATVAGTACTEWDVATNAVNTTICITDDGVMLRAAGMRPGTTERAGMEATEVKYGPQDAARFTVPQGYQEMRMPGAAAPGAPGAPGAPPAR